MAYQVLARKYRPQRFSDVIGQDHVTRTLLNALAQGRIAHGYVFSGHRGIGKTTIARIVAMALNCRTEIGTDVRPTPEPCGVCESCTEVRAGNAVDVIEIDAATNRGIDEIRELRDAARYRPARDRYKIYILDEAHQITDAAFNALLKTLEEPPDHVVFMMATTQPEDIPQTIRSRCQHFSFHAVKFDDILVQLRTIAGQEQIAANDEALALLAEAGDGSMRDALSIMDQAIASAPLVEGQPKLDAGQIRELMGAVPNSVFERLLEAIGENQSGPVIEEINRLLNAGNSASQLARQFVRYLRNVLMARIAGEGTELLQLSPDERRRVSRSALLFSEEDLTRFLGVMLRTFDELNYRQEPRFHLELGLLKLVHLQRLLPVEQLLSQLGGSAPRLGGGPLPGGQTRSPRGTTASPAQQPGPSPDAKAAVEAGPILTRPGLAPPSAALAGGGSTSLHEAPSSRPAFSPFEADSRRKGPSVPAQAGESARSIAPATPHSPAPQPLGLMQPETLPGEAESAPQPEVIDGASPEADGASPGAPAFHEPASAAGAEAKALSSEETYVAIPPGRQAAKESAPLLPPGNVPIAGREVAQPEFAKALVETEPPLTTSLDAIRQHVCAALEEAGHSTAAALLSNAEWTRAGEAILVKVAAKKTMLGLTMNTDAERVSREAIRSLLGKPSPLSFVPGEGAAASSPVRSNPVSNQPGRSGSVQVRAMENPLVKQAQELFHAEVRSVVDLRNK